MASKPPAAVISEASPSVQTHLGILQGVIERMAGNSAQAKAWCVTLVSAILVVVANNNKASYAFIALVPTILFAALDVYYLALEKGFRNAYTQFVANLHHGITTTDDLFAVAPIGSASKLQWKAIKSFSVWGFYVGLAVLILLVYAYVLK